MSEEGDVTNAAPNTSNTYSDAYQKLVGDGIGKDEFDLVGIVAYALYKKGKIEFIVNNQRTTQDWDVTEYHKTLNDTHVAALRSMAEDILNVYADELEDRYNENTRDGVVNSELFTGIENSIQSLKGYIAGRTSTWAAVVSGTVSSFVFAVLLTIAA